ncbi:RING/FYVE/PHD zinc finger superfamily protein [Striga hermonthica]|uniref:RING/FYVE/PHD zinc finger superfamily protein n=1 Tax=Striga hermonthica TaxID=68872 RepID=A0A9N7R0E8_STRHE|nr:RING/FYVE/PHD zinc finger superfamily protein [Striga hermonthica]
MKSRSHRLPVSEPHHEDWVNGSWTVDCVCGVNYDDGEEMVDCDECGVWVHTRCFHFVKSEKSFACDKCKSKNSVGVPDDSEETEVAEFLVELPTKTLRMDNPSPASVAPRRPFKLWTGMPLEDRGHVQGVPGGEPGLFSGNGMSSIFGPELWKSTGYVPKKFNFRYSEFQHLNHGTVEEKVEKELDKISGRENGNQADSGAGVLFSLLKENNKALPTPAVDSSGVRSPVEGTDVHEVRSLSQHKNLGNEGLGFSVPEDSMKKETSSSVPIVLRFGKCQKEKLGMLKEQNVKKVRTVDYKDDKKRPINSSKAESSQDGSSKALSAHCNQNTLPNQADRLGECATNLASKERGLGVTHRNDVSSDEASKKENKEDHVPVRSEKFLKTNNNVESLTEPNGSLRQPVRKESGGDAGGGAGSGKIVTRDKDSLDVDVKIGSADAKESQRGQSCDIDESNTRPTKKLKGDHIADDPRHLHGEPLPGKDAKLATMKVITTCPDSSVKIFSEEGRIAESSAINSEASKQKVPDATRSLNIGTSRTDKSDESPGNPCQYKRQPTSEGSIGARKKSSGLKYNSEVADELHKSNGTARSNSTASYQRKGVSEVKSTSTSSGGISKLSDNHMTASTQNPSFLSRENGLSNSTVATAKDSVSADVVAREEKSVRPKKLVKEYSRHPLKISESSKSSHTPDSKIPTSDSKGRSIHTSKVPLVPTAAADHMSSELTSPLQVESASDVQIKAVSSTEPGKVEKQSESSGHQSSRRNVAPMAASTPANVPATLSDEELALLLHQELNSSPRVPRVPRMRHAGSLPQLTGPSATSVLMKRASTGGKDHIVASRRTKDLSGEGAHGSVEVDNETKKMDRKPTSPYKRRRDSGFNADTLRRREADGGRGKSVQSAKKVSTGTTLSSTPDANGHKLSFDCPSSRATSDNDQRVVGRQTTRTLPGLIAEIMCEGKRITYEELCNAVLPHWPHLRKHNGERYAYSSHSQAVLDCLRNRSEWACLVDRGPKATLSRKRRKLDGDSMSIESEDNEENGIKNPKESGSKSYESQHEDFPKGKRKARKQRRLGRAAPQRRRRADVVSDDESEEFSSSSEESSTSSEEEEEDEDEDEVEEEEDEEEEEEIQGGGASVHGSEASASSDEV